MSEEDDKKKDLAKEVNKPADQAKNLVDQTTKAPVDLAEKLGKVATDLPKNVLSPLGNTKGAAPMKEHSKEQGVSPAPKPDAGPKSPTPFNMKPELKPKD
ncbi:MAG: hypothetical protein NXI01_07650 [Gammaproteobacteria bacterium]|nr:hypothetical protein [Gammaproteobacteria bacterium]